MPHEKVFQAPDVSIHVNLENDRLEVVWKDVIDAESLANAHSILKAVIQEHGLKKYYGNVVNALLTLDLEHQMREKKTDLNLIYEAGIRIFAMHARSQEQIALRKPLMDMMTPDEAEIFWTTDEAEAKAWLDQF